MLNKKIKNKYPFNSVFVLGGSSEIAHELCFNLVLKGVRRIHLVSRDPRKNKAFIERLNKDFNLEIVNQKFDLMKEELNIKPNLDFFDLYIIAAGYLGDSILANNNNEEAIKIARVNYYSLIPWINAITSQKRTNKPGAIWIFSSVAGDRGKPSNYQYGAAKAALTIYCEGLLNICNDKKFKVRIIKFGFIYTSMTIKKAPKFLCASKVYIAKTLVNTPHKEGIEYLPFWWFFVMKIITILPRFIIARLRK